MTHWNRIVHMAAHSMWSCDEDDCSREEALSFTVKPILSILSSRHASMVTCTHYTHCDMGMFAWLNVLVVAHWLCLYQATTITLIKQTKVTRVRQVSMSKATWQPNVGVLFWVWLHLLDPTNITHNANILVISLYHGFTVHF